MRGLLFCWPGGAPCRAPGHGLMGLQEAAPSLVGPPGPRSSWEPCPRRPPGCGCWLRGVASGTTPLRLRRHRADTRRLPGCPKWSPLPVLEAVGLQSGAQLAPGGGGGASCLLLQLPVATAAPGSLSLPTPPSSPVPSEEFGPRGVPRVTPSARVPVPNQRQLRFGQVRSHVRHLQPPGPARLGPLGKDPSHLCCLHAVPTPGPVSGTPGWSQVCLRGPTCAVCEGTFCPVFQPGRRGPAPLAPVCCWVRGPGRLTSPALPPSGCSQAQQAPSVSLLPSHSKLSAVPLPLWAGLSGTFSVSVFPPPSRSGPG